jgi:nitroreductase
MAEDEKEPVMTAQHPELAESLRRSRNTRAFTSDPVPEDALRGILEIARWTGSAGNLQPWQLIVVDDPGIIRQLAATGPNLPWLAGAPLLIVLAMDDAAPGNAAFDEGRLAERIFAAARAYGLEAGLGWFLPDARDAARTILAVPEGYVVRTVIAIGVPAADRRSPAGPTPPPFPKTAPRKPLAEIVHRNRFGDRHTGIG